MDAKYLAEIKERVEKDIPDIAAPVFRDRKALLAEVERLQTVVKMQRVSCSLVETAKAAGVVDEIAAKDRQIATLKMALELACEDQTEHCPYTLHAGKRVCSEYPMRGLRCQDCAPAYYIHQVQEQEGKK